MMACTLWISWINSYSWQIWAGKCRSKKIDMKLVRVKDNQEAKWIVAQAPIEQGTKKMVRLCNLCWVTTRKMTMMLITMPTTSRSAIFKNNWLDQAWIPYWFSRRNPMIPILISRMYITLRIVEKVKESTMATRVPWQTFRGQHCNHSKSKVSDYPCNCRGRAHTVNWIVLASLTKRTGPVFETVKSCMAAPRVVAITRSMRSRKIFKPAK